MNASRISWGLKRFFTPWSPVSASFWLSLIGFFLVLWPGVNKTSDFIGGMFLLTAGFGGWGSIYREVAMTNGVSMEPGAVVSKLKSGAENIHNAIVEVLKHSVPAIAGIIVLASGYF